MLLRKSLTLLAVTGGMLIAPALPSQAAPSGGCPYPPNRPVLTASASPKTIVHSRSTKVFGTFTQNNCGIHRGQIRLQRRALVNGKPSGSWSTFTTVTTDDNGAYSATRKSARNEQMRAVFPAAGGYPRTVSSTLNELVRTSVTVHPKAASACAIHISGALGPVAKSHYVYVQGRGAAGHFKGWKNLWRTKTNSKGQYSSTHKLHCGTTYNVSVYTSKTSSNAAGRSHTVYGIKTHS